MRVVQVANFYGPRSGGLRTAVDRLGAEYSAAGHEVFLIVPGPTAERVELRSGVTRISLPARLIPFTGDYRAVLPKPVTALLEDLAPDAIEVSDRLTLRSLGSWGRRHGIGTVMISHERLDRLVGQILPRRVARSIADYANRRTVADYDAVVCTTAFARAEFDRIHASNVLTVPLGVDLDQFHPRHRSEQMRMRWAGREQLLLVHCGRLSVEKHAHRSIDTVGALRHSGVDARLVVVGEGPMRARLERQAARLPVDFTGYVGCRDTVATSLRLPMSRWHPAHTRPSGSPRWRRWPAARPPSCHRRRHCRDPHHRQRRDGGQRSACDRSRRVIDHQQTGSTAPQQCTTTCRAVHLAACGCRNARRARRGIGDSLGRGATFSQ